MDAIRKLAQERDIPKHIIVNKSSGLKTEMQRNNGMYKYPVWIKRRIRKESVNEGCDQMGSGDWKSPNKKGKIKWDEPKICKEYNVNAIGMQSEDEWAPF